MTANLTQCAVGRKRLCQLRSACCADAVVIEIELRQVEHSDEGGARGVHPDQRQDIGPFLPLRQQT